MNYENYFKLLFESMLDYKKVVLIIILSQNDKDFFYARLVLLSVILVI